MGYSREYFRDWYSKNRARISERRKAQYRSNPELRAKMIENSIRSRERNRKHPPVGYDYTFERTAGMLGVTLWTLREWRRRNYYPEPLPFGRGMYFTLSQIHLLEKLRDFFESHGKRVRVQDKAALDSLAGWIYANW